MAEVDVVINGRSYLMGCDDGQEEHLRQLAGYVGQRVDELAATVGQVGDARLLLMASLLIADELSDLREEMEALRGDAERHVAEAEAELAERLEHLAQRLESVAAAVQAS